MRGPALELSAATCSFGELVAVDRLSMGLAPGRVHGLIGENGAGKSTAMKMLSGHLAPTAGRVEVDGERLWPATAQHAIGLGIGMVHQHFMLIEHFTALENLMLGCEPTRGWGRLDVAAARDRAERVGEQAGLAVDLDRQVSELAVGERQRLEILRVLFRGARAILLDEPTAVLSPVEVAELYATLRKLAEEGATIGVVTHRLDEVVRYCDEVTVMRRGRGTLHEHLQAEGSAERRAETEDRLTRAIMGGEPPPEACAPTFDPDVDPVLELCDVAVAAASGDGSAPRPLDGVSLAVCPGEIVGIAGVEGNGQRELARVLAGLEPIAAGEIRLEGTPLASAASSAPSRPPPGATGAGWLAVRRGRARGLVVVHEDRHKDELLLDATVADNLVVGDLGAVEERERVAKRFERFDVYPPDTGRLAGELSGGNQQKVVLGRALDRPLKALVLAQPTRGVDVGTARTIHHAVTRSAEQGVAVILISADLAELRSLAHRIAVLRRGRLAAELPPSVSEDVIGRAMLGLEEPS
ncbi:MAG: ATP-binding cassette domain-containing protein [Deltaproteobacteria bacterium]|nr:ATP-binding cassette domain-containing protein [Deltaproteobacteria bacterium]MBW2533524.1 ATP-binding cassette domain-containing protein [Deltaproteobacteria bacterium]